MLTKSKRQFIPRNPQKYVGKYPIYMRSKWEEKFANMLDNNKNVLEWSSESIVIPYVDPLNERRIRRYYPDFYVKSINSNKEIEKWIIEIKPEKETRQPVKRGKKKKSTLIYEQLTYERNKAKWKAAEKFCKKFGYKFKILTERNLFKQC